MASNTQAVCGSFKEEMLMGIHNLNNGGDTIMAALFFRNSGLGANTISYTSVAAFEVTGTNYTAGGIVVPNATGVLGDANFNSYWTPSANLVWANITINSVFDCCLLYNASKANRSISVYTFAGQTSSSSSFTLVMPPNISTSALIQVS